MNLKLMRYRILSRLTFGKKRKHYKNRLCQEKLKNKYEVSGNGNKIFLVSSDGSMEEAHNRLSGINIIIAGSNNRVFLSREAAESKMLNINLQMEGDDNYFKIADFVRGNWNIAQYGGNNYFSVGENTRCGEVNAALHSNRFEIGQDCMISSSEELWTDGHSIIDNGSKEILNYSETPIIIGNHVWLGRRCTLTKRAQIPDNCIVGIGSVATRAFKEQNCILAGNPAKIVKRNVNWDGRRPADYKADFEKTADLAA